MFLVSKDIFFPFSAACSHIKLLSFRCHLIFQRPHNPVSPIYSFPGRLCAQFSFCMFVVVLRTLGKFFMISFFLTLQFFLLHFGCRFCWLPFLFLISNELSAFHLATFFSPRCVQIRRNKSEEVKEMLSK